MLTCLGADSRNKAVGFAVASEEKVCGRGFRVEGGVVGGCGGRCGDGASGGEIMRTTESGRANI